MIPAAFLTIDGNEAVARVAYRLPSADRSD